MKKLIPISALIVMACLASGCASNYVSGGVFSGSTTLIDAAGNISEGEIIFNLASRDGTISIPDTKYGDLAVVNFDNGPMRV